MEMESLRCVQDILQRSNGILCPYLEPGPIARHLQSEGLLSLNDISDIQSNHRKDRQVQKLLDILCYKPESAYLEFMKALEKQDEDLFLRIRAVEEFKSYIPSKLSLSFKTVFHIEKTKNLSLLKVYST